MEIPTWRNEKKMETYDLIVPCHFGMEAILKREIIDLGYEIRCVEDGKITFIGDAEAVCPQGPIR